MAPLSAHQLQVWHIHDACCETSVDTLFAVGATAIKSSYEAQMAGSVLSPCIIEPTPRMSSLLSGTKLLQAERANALCKQRQPPHHQKPQHLVPLLDPWPQHLLPLTWIA